MVYGDIKVSNPKVTPNKLFNLLDQNKIKEAKNLYPILDSSQEVSREDIFFNGLYNSNSLNRMSQLLMEKQKYDAALVPLEWALSLDPKHPNNHDNIAEFYIKTGNTAKAIEHSQMALKYLATFNHPNKQFIEAIRNASEKRINSIENSKNEN